MPSDNICRKRSISELDDNIFYDCLYGSESILEESEGYVLAKLHEIEREIDKLSNKLKEAYFVAIQQEVKQKTHYVRSRKFLLMFLRADQFDVKKAALRLALFFKFKLDLFGPELLPRRIKQDDLNEMDKYVLSSGVAQFAGLDCGGRSIILFRRDRLKLSGLYKTETAINVWRAAFYITMYAIEHNEQTQTKGLVGIRWQMNSVMPLKAFFMLFIKKGRMFSQAIPFRHVCTHTCCDSEQTRSATWMEWMMRTRWQHIFHGPTPADCLAGLSKYGIDVDLLPVTTNGSFKVGTLKRQLEQMQEKESQARLYEVDNAMHHHAPQKDLIMDCIKSSDTKSGIVKPSVVCPLVSVATHTLSEEHLPMRLMRILDQNTFPDAIWWICGGTAFAIHKHNFTAYILSNEFNGIKFDSFARRMRRWNFNRLSCKKGSTSPNCVVYEHPLFQRQMPHLLQNWSNTATKDKFPVRLMKIMKSNGNADAIWWVNDGNAFAIQKDKFSSNVLDMHFRGLKFDSFCRNLMRWGFNRIHDHDSSVDKILIFEHKLFRENTTMTQNLMEKWTRSN